MLSRAFGISTEAVDDAARGFEDYTANIHAARIALEQFTAAELREAAGKTIGQARGKIAESFVSTSDAMSVISGLGASSLANAESYAENDGTVDPRLRAFAK